MIAAAVAAAPPPFTRVDRGPPARPPSPIANTAAPRVSALPCGSKARSASTLSSGISSSAEIRIGARTGVGHQDRRGDRRGRAPLRRPASPPPVAATRRWRGRRRAPPRRRWRPRRRRRPWSCSWSRRRGSRARWSTARPGRRSPGRLGAADRRRGAVDRVAAAAAEDRGDDEDDGEEDRAADQLQRQRDRPPRAARRRFGGLGGFGGFGGGFALSPPTPLPEPPHLSVSLWPQRKATAENWLAGRIDWLTDQSINPVDP